jgi:hypothetical protein
MSTVVGKIDDATWVSNWNQPSPQVSPTLLEFQTQASFTSMCCQRSWSVWYKCSQAGPPINSAQVSKPRQPSQQLSPTHFHLNDLCNILQFDHLAAICCLVQGWDAQYWLNKSRVKFKWHLYNANPQHLPAIQALQSVQFLVKASQGLIYSHDSTAYMLPVAPFQASTQLCAVENKFEDKSWALRNSNFWLVRSLSCIPASVKRAPSLTARHSLRFKIVLIMHLYFNTRIDSCWWLLSHQMICTGAIAPDSQS